MGTNRQEAEAAINRAYEYLNDPASPPQQREAMLELGFAIVAALLNVADELAGIGEAYGLSNP